MVGLWTRIVACAFGGIVSSVALASVTTAGCSSAAVDPFACDPGACKAGNRCIATTTDAKCRLPCAAHADCPFNYHCDANAGGEGAYCAADAQMLQEEATGQWGAACRAPLGLEANPDCDSAQNFLCYGVSPSDADAFCTRYDCAADLDCGRGFWCGRVNDTPDVTTAARSRGAAQTHTVCLPRGYCAPCGSDIDCPKVDGIAQRCVDGAPGERFCAPECTSDSSCALDAACVAKGAARVCAPRAGTCKGDGGLCAPCRSDADCNDGYCMPATQSPERFCSVRSKVPCTVDANGVLTAQCPASTGVDGVVMGCTIAVSPEAAPVDQCVGEVTIGQGADQDYVPGCWTKHP